MFFTTDGKLSDESDFVHRNSKEQGCKENEKRESEIET